ncbi:Slx4p interacting protein [Gnomoniopsis smithogilvyi]|uniref:Slx4p interacting protein n=1 Tax=Gnomoniopsis smithogilvyi TaxID=1191159 RepID=A0A9W8YRT1_9PEZI|nr:Slx4p interacting protein [Gnomoniopsis smithogilvyi]
MAVQSKPIPALYVVYILRSTVRKASLYIGSTPHPPRRLNQHNGKAKGGAARTSRNSLRPWEMVGIVSGFPSMVGALKFEWALNNPHLSLHIAPEERLSISTQRKRNGQPKRPPHNITSILSNLHLLLRVPSFSRWPLTLHFFDKDVHTKWGKYCTTPGLDPLRRTLQIVTDFAPNAAEALVARTSAKPVDRNPNSDDSALEGSEEEYVEESGGPKWGIHALPLDHYPLATYLEKGQNITTFEQEGMCVICHEHLGHDKGLYTICSNGECEGVGHLDCWSRYLLQQQGEHDNDAILLPMEGRCPKCDGAVRWVDMMKELTLRTRGQKEVDKILRKHRKATGVTKSKAKAKVKATADGRDSAKRKLPAKAKGVGKGKGKVVTK